MNRNTQISRLGGGVMLAVTGLALALAIPAGAQSEKFVLDPQGTKTARVGYYPVPVKFDTTKPAGVKKEPVYVGTPQYGMFQIGNGPKSVHYIALDEPTTGDWKIYVDLNGNGDLTSSGDGAWSKKTDGARAMYGVNSYTVRGSWGTATKEQSFGDYGVAFYRFVGPPARLFMYREGARVGKVTVDGKSHKAILFENDADGLYSKPLDDNGKPVSGTATKPVWLLIDSNDDGKWSAPIDVRSPFKLGETAFVANITPDGSRVALAKTDRKVAVAPKPAERKPLLAAGVPAPDFEAEAWGGGSLHLADFRGKVVILDFWATWCGPCQRSMPHIEKIYQSVKDKDIVVLGVCVWDDKEAYTKWVPEKKDVYHFKFAFDPAAKSGKSIAGDKFNVSGIPTTYIIDKEGKVAASIVGYSDGDKRVEEALSKLGIEATQ